MPWSLSIPAFIAGFLMFLAPCTLPLVPGYLIFISGVSLNDLKNPATQEIARRRILLNSLLYILGFSVVFIALGLLFSGLGGFFVGEARIWLSRIGGFFVFILGLSMMRIFNLPAFQFLSGNKQLTRWTKNLTPGKPLSSFLFGATFAFGWTPCIGPVLGSILLLASSNATIAEGGILLCIFSLGLAIPFFLVALAIGQATRFIKRISRYLELISIIAGAFIAFLGFLMFTGQMSIWFGFAYRHLQFINFNAFLNYL